MRVSTVSVAAVLAASTLWVQPASASIVSYVSNVAITGSYTVWTADPSGVLTNSGQPTTPPPLASYLTGTAGDPGDNIDVGAGRTFSEWQAGDRTTLTGDLGNGLSIALATPTQSDWQANGLALAYEYVNAALASIGKSSFDWNENALGGGTTVTFDEAVQSFVFGDTINPGSGAFRVSDPNAGYILLETGVASTPIIRVGEQGFYDASTVLDPLLPFVDYDPNTDPSPPQASEVALLSVYGPDNTLLSREFKYSFDATRTGQGASTCYNGQGDPEGTCLHSGNYELTQAVPAPTTAALLTLALGGLVGVRHRFELRPVRG